MELGASFIHEPKKETNLISKFVEGANWGKIPGKFGSTTYYYENEGLMKSKHILKAEDLHEQMEEEIDLMMRRSSEDKSVEEVTQNFFKRRVAKQSEQVRKIYEALNTYNANVEGIELNEMSLKDYWEDNTETKDDFLPEGGYSKVISTLFSHCRPTLKLGEKVTKIDY